MLLAVAAAFAFEPVLESHAEGVVDWTNFRILVSAESAGSTGAMNDIESAEGDARGKLGPKVEALARAVRIDHERTAGQLLDGADAVADRLERNLAYWEVYEARYHSGGGVVLEAAISLQKWLRPALVTFATTVERPPVLGGASGAVVDARGLDLACAVSPEFVDPTGGHLYGMVDMTAHAASQRPPVAYVRDPADPVAARRAGGTPVFLRPDSVRDGTDLVFGADASAKLRDLATASDVLRNGMVVVVVDR